MVQLFLPTVILGLAEDYKLPQIQTVIFSPIGFDFLKKSLKIYDFLSYDCKYPNRSVPESPHLNTSW